MESPHPLCERVQGGPAQPPPCVSMNKTNLSVAGTTSAGMGFGAPGCPLGSGTLNPGTSLGTGTSSYPSPTSRRPTTRGRLSSPPPWLGLKLTGRREVSIWRHLLARKGVQGQEKQRPHRSENTQAIGEPGCLHQSQSARADLRSLARLQLCGRKTSLTVGRPLPLQSAHIYAHLPKANK